MNKLILLISTMFILTNLYAQKITESQYIGFVAIENGPIYPFELYFKEQDGLVNGYSITNKETINETKSDITGHYNKKEKTFTLKESQVLETNSEADLNSFCYIHMNLNKRGKRFSIKRLQGNFVGYMNNGTKCANGSIVVLEKEKFEKKIKKVEQKIEKSNLKIDNIIKTQVLKSGDNTEINWISNQLKIDIWDANKEDGDKITLKINGNIILNNYEVKNKKKTIKYKLKAGENIIELTATNEGKQPPNTSRIEIRDKKIKYPIMIQLKMQKTAIIKILKK
ncbi:MAG: hypothetical protein CMP51_06795 [Flavobacteriales bacterium]|nr:hypothetical protein [Flavobacteriales bacterium]|tara:strand:- start:268 stop:1113 length:846 start_codon:yes stop_codon:yes gene_type:complete